MKSKQPNTLRIRAEDTCEDTCEDRCRRLFLSSPLSRIYCTHSILHSRHCGMCYVTMCCFLISAYLRRFVQMLLDQGSAVCYISVQQ